MKKILIKYILVIDLVYKKVLQYNKNMNLINEFFSLSEAHRLTGALISKISLVCNLKRKSHLGFIWRFSD